jgi:hypothetical protein
VNPTERERTEAVAAGVDAHCGYERKRPFPHPAVEKVACASGASGLNRSPLMAWTDTGEGGGNVVIAGLRVTDSVLRRVHT